MYLSFLGDFTILNQYVGTISVAKLINAERISLYNLTVMAKDEGDFIGGIALNSTVSGIFGCHQDFRISWNCQTIA